MATGGGEEKDISGSFVTCHICLEEYKDPRVLPCHHTFCLRCLQLHVTSNGSQDDTFSCPVCRQKTLTPKEGLQGLPHNLFMAEVQSTKADVKSCDLCGGDRSTYHCQECHQYICDCCKSFHDDLNEGHTLKIVKDGPIQDVALEDQGNSTQFSEKLTEIVLQFSQSVLELKEELRTCEEEKMKYIFNRKEIHQRVKQQAHQIKVLTDTRCEELIKETDDLLKEKLTKLAQYTNTVSNQHRHAEEMYTEAINLQQNREVELDQVELLTKKFSEMQHNNVNPRVRDPLKVFYHGSTPNAKDIGALMGTIKSSHGVESKRTTQEPPHSETQSIIQKWCSSWTKGTAEKVSEFQLEHCKTSKDCSYTSIAQNSTGDIFVLDSAHNRVETYTSKGKFLMHFDLWLKNSKPYKLAVVGDTRLVVAYDRQTEHDESQVIDFSLPQLGCLKKIYNGQSGRVPIASCGDDAACIGADIKHQYGTWAVTYINDNANSSIYWCCSSFRIKYKWTTVRPSDMAGDKEKNVFLLFPDNHCLLGLNSKGKEKFIYGTENIPGTGVGQLTHPSCVCTDNNGDIYIGDTGRIVKIKSDGTFIYHITGVCQPMSGYVFLVDHQGHIVTVEDGKLIKYIY